MPKTCKENKCPECNGDMWDNTVGKKPSKNYPDFKCKDCGHGVWLTKQEKEEIKANPPPAQEKLGGSKVANYGSSVPPSMYGAWSVNLLIAGLTSGKYKSMDEALKDLPKVFTAVGKTVNSLEVAPVAKSTPQAAPEIPVDADVEAEAKPEPKVDEGGLDLGDLEDDTFDNLDI